jgi:hypothetical protein
MTLPSQPPDCSKQWPEQPNLFPQSIGEQRQQLTDLNTAQLNEGRIDYDYQVGQKVLVRKTVHFAKQYLKEPWTIMSVHTNGTIRVQCRNKSERTNIQRVKMFVENLDNK